MAEGHREVIAYHFTCDHAIAGARRDGLTLGGIAPYRNGHPVVIRGYQWLTVNPSFQAQAWATRNALKCDRTEWRLTLAIPEAWSTCLHDWSSIKALIPADLGWVAAIESVGGSEDWRIYRGDIPRDWIHEVARNPLLTYVPA